MNSPYTAVQYYPEFPFHRLRDPSSRLAWRESSFLTTMSQNQSAQTADFFGQDVFNQLFDMLDQSAIHSVQPIELNFTDSPTDRAAGNTIQISMDCITMHEPDETLSVTAGQQFNAAPASVAEVPALIYQYMSSLGKDGGGNKGGGQEQEQGRIT
ncbi:hypothetical protein Q5P01_016436 [Channa striata]|uniref:Uncharacterized protein n=1 Tax=Channa striata TaxID=64152 RepID=A0AA88MGZ6_CHASR|nr:hypothetical protein Q5P01_016436 [Channa striata]